MKKSYRIALLSVLFFAAAVIPAQAAVPQAPAGLRKARINSEQVRVRWRDRSDNETGFRIERRPITENAFESRGTVPAGGTEFIDAAAKGTVYIYRVVAFNGDGDSRSSNDCYVNRNPALVPVYFNVRLIALTVARVSWSDRTNGETGYEIQRAEPGKPFKTIIIVPANTEVYDDYSLSPANTYIYRVRTIGRPAICWDNSGYSVERALTTKGGVRLLSVDVRGTGKGMVTSTPAGISCGSKDDHCIAEFPLATDVTLVATPNLQSRFRGWVGIYKCEGLTAPCTFSMGQDREVGAAFRLK